MVLSLTFTRIEKILTFVFILLVSGLINYSYSQCQLSGMKLEKSACTAEKTFYVTINFNYQGNSELFNLTGNGVNYGTFAYTKLPIKLGPLKADCNTEYEFKAYDSKDEKCNTSSLLGKVCCETNTDCKLSNLEYFNSACDANGEFTIKFKFSYQNTSDSFDVYDQNNKWIKRFAYAKQPYIIGPLKGDCTTNYTLVLRDYKNERCSFKKEIGTVCCTTNSECKLADLKIEKTTCNEEKQFYSILNFSYKNTSDCFTVNGNGVSYGTFKYSDLPIKIGPLKGNCETNYGFVIRDCKNEKCVIEGGLGKVCCEDTGNGRECMLSGLKVVKTSCTAEKTFYTYLNLQYKNTSECFTITGNGINYGTFKYSQLPLKLGPHKGNCETNYEFVIRDCKNEKCSISSNIGKVCCEDTGNGKDCNISELNLNRSECNEDGTFYVKLNFSHKNTSECFILRQNDNIIGKFPYTKLPLEIGPFKGDCKTEYIFSVTDCLNENCAAKKALGKVCCETQGDCEMGELQVTKSDCDKEGNFKVKLNFKYANVSECFVLVVNGKVVSKFPYSMLPLELGPYPGDCKTEYNFLVYDCNNERCYTKASLGKVCCENNNKDCKLSNLKFERSECDAEKNFYVYFNFTYQNTSDCFTVTGNGINYGKYKYADLPIKIGPLKGNCETEYEFVITDCENKECSIVKELGKVCCEQNNNCEMGELQVTKSDCDKVGNFKVKLNFKYANVSECFVLIVNGKVVSKFPYSMLPLELGPYPGDCKTEYNFLVYDCNNERCYTKASLGKVCCENNNKECKLSNLKFERSECDAEKNFYVYFNFTYQNTSDCFTVTGNGINYGKYMYADLPIKIGPLKGNCETEYEFVITDCENKECFIVKELGKVCCEQNNNCEMGELQVTKSDCDKEGNFKVKLNFKYANVSECFVLLVNGKPVSKFPYSMLPLEIGPYPGDCKTEYNFLVYDCNNERCYTKASLGKVCCQGQNLCELSNLEIAKGDCDAEGKFLVKLNFKYKNVSECFIVKQNNNVLGKFKYSQLPLQLGPFKGDCTTNYIFTITDCLSEKCSLTKEIGKVCCKPVLNTCQISDLKYEKTSCNENKEVYLIVKFLYKNTSECFTASLNGKSLGTFEYKNLPLKIGPLKADCQTKYNLVIRDCKSERCALEYPIGTLCCDKLGANCEISNLEAKALECTGAGQYAVKINFSHTGTKGVGFDVFDQNGKSLGFYSYTSIPLTLKEFKASGNEVDYIKVCENDNERCCAEIKFSALKCLKGSSGGFKIDDVELRYSNDHIILYSENAFPEQFDYLIHDMNGRSLHVEEAYRDQHNILIPTVTLENGMYLIHMQNSYNLRNLKFIK